MPIDFVKLWREALEAGSVQWAAVDQDYITEGLLVSGAMAATHASARVLEAAFTAAVEEERRKALEEAARICEEQQQSFLSPEYATGQPLSSFQERFACGQCASSIRALIDQPREPKQP